MKENCTGIDTHPDNPLEPTPTCPMVFNDEIGVILTLIGWVISGAWLAVTIYKEQHDYSHTGLAPKPPPDDEHK